MKKDNLTIEGITLKKSRTNYLYFIIAFLGIIIYSALAINSKAIWSDEAFSFGMARLGFLEMWNLPSVDVHPPLYYFYLKIFMTIWGESLVSAKFSSVLPVFFILTFGGYQLSKLFSRRIGLLFMVIFLAFPSIHEHSVEIRMYSLATAFVFANVIFAYRCVVLQNKLDWFWLAICSAGAAYTHYYSFLAVGLIDFALLITIAQKKHSLLKFYAGSFILMVLLYLPWCGHMLGQLKYKAENEYWIAPVTLIDICGYIYKTFMIENMPIFTILLGLTYLFLLIWAIKKGYSNITVLLLLPILVAAIGIAVSIVVRPVLLFRYLIPTLCVLPVFAAIILDHMFDTEKSKKLAVVILSIIMLGGALNATSLLIKECSRPENLFDKAWVKEQDCDLYLVISLNTHASTMLACFEEDKPIYAVTVESGDANPFPNIESYNSFDINDDKSIILITDNNQELPSELLDNYSCIFKQNIIEGDDRVFTYDVYELNHAK